MSPVALFLLLAAAQDPARLWVRLVDEHGAPTAARIDIKGPRAPIMFPAAALNVKLGKVPKSSSTLRVNFR